MEYTPGPWRVGDAGHTIFGPKTDNPSPETVATAIRIGDAQLIAEAPNMLDVLKRITELAANKGETASVLLNISGELANIATEAATS